MSPTFEEKKKELVKLKKEFNQYVEIVFEWFTEHKRRVPGIFHREMGILLDKFRLCQGLEGDTASNVYIMDREYEIIKERMLWIETYSHSLDLSALESRATGYEG